MLRSRFSFGPQRLWPYLLTGVSMAFVTLGLVLLRRWIDNTVVALTYLLLIGWSASQWGRGPGIFAAFSAFLLLNFFFIPPLYVLSPPSLPEFLVLGAFLLVAFAAVWRIEVGLTHVRARERDAIHLYELSAALASQRSQDAIARTLTERVHQLLQADQAQVVIQPEASQPPLVLSAPARASPGARPDHVLPLLAARGLLGEIRFWRKAAPLRPAEERLLQTIATQGALALERAMLAQAETRAKVLEETDRLKTAMLSSVSHELRTPLVTIKAAATSLNSGEVAWESPARAELLTAVEEEVDHLNRLVGNLLDMSRIEAGVLRPQRQWNVLPEIIGSVLQRLRRATAGYQLEIDAPDDLPFVPVDYVQIEQVFSNLISNSLKFAPRGSTIRIRANAPNGQWMRVQVSNQGPPIPANDVARIFDKFYRATVARQITGSGLGLTICKGLVEAHGGRIWAENTGEGVAINFTLPLQWSGTPPPHLPEPEAL